MKPCVLPTTDKLHSLFRYDECSGKLYWKHRPDMNKTWNSRFSGTECGTLSHGRITLRIKRKPYFVHRIIWKMFNGDEPLYIDHIDGNPLNNDIHNLRSVTLGENQKNRRPTKNKNVIFGIRRTDHFSWVIKLKEGYFGAHKCLGKALKTRDMLYKKYGYHVNHGKIILHQN